MGDHVLPNVWEGQTFWEGTPPAESSAAPSSQIVGEDLVDFYDPMSYDSMSDPAWVGFVTDFNQGWEKARQEALAEDNMAIHPPSNDDLALDKVSGENKDTAEPPETLPKKTPEALPPPTSEKEAAEALRMHQILHSNAVFRKVPMPFGDATEWILECHASHQAATGGVGCAPTEWFRKLKEAGIEAKVLTEEHTIKGMRSIIYKQIERDAAAEEKKRKEKTEATAKDLSKDCD